jgi:hypothetical protein
MSARPSLPDCGQRTVPAADRDVVSRQLGRAPRGDWRVQLRCSHGCPVVIAVSPLIGAGELFPTTFWLTCPWLVAAVSGLEAEGSAARWTAQLASDAGLAQAAAAADVAYRRARAALGGGTDPCPSVGVAGQSDPRVVKCLHARVAASLAGVPDPVGEGALADLTSAGVLAECLDARCSIDAGLASSE